MSNSTKEMPEEIANARAQDVMVSATTLWVHLKDGRTLQIPTKWYPRLHNATQTQKDTWKLIGNGVGIHWPEIDEDLSVEGFLMGWKAPDGEY